MRARKICRARKDAHSKTSHLPYIRNSFGCQTDIAASSCGQSLALSWRWQGHRRAWRAAGLVSPSRTGAEAKKPPQNNPLPPLTLPQIEWKHTRSSYFFSGNYTQHLVFREGGGERGKGGRNGFSRRRSPLPLPFLPPPLPLRRWRRSLRSGVICLLTLLLNGKPPSERPFGKDKHCRRLFRSFRDFLT